MKVFKFGQNVLKLGIQQRKSLSYVQGQSPSPGVREYFYYIDHQGQLFLDDAKMKNFTSCFKEKKFLHFFFTRLKYNETGKYDDKFPFISPCGREQNFVRCDDKPIVYTHVVEKKSSSSGDLEYHLSYAHAGDLLTARFEPENLCMLPQTGRIYHPSNDCVGIGLVKSSLAIELSKNFDFMKDLPDALPTHFTWNGVKFELSQKLLNLVQNDSKDIL